MGVEVVRLILEGNLLNKKMFFSSNIQERLTETNNKRI